MDITTDLSQVSDKLYHIMLYASPLSRFELTTSVVIGTDCIGSCKSNNHTITANTVPIKLVFIYFFNNVIYFIQMLATINTPNVQTPFGVSLLHLVLIIQGYIQNYMKYIYNLNTISI